MTSIVVAEQQHVPAGARYQTLRGLGWRYGVGSAEVLALADVSG